MQTFATPIRRISPQEASRISVDARVSRSSVCIPCFILHVGLSTLFGVFFVAASLLDPVTCGRYGTGRPDVLRIPSGCKAPSLYGLVPEIPPEDAALEGAAAEEPVIPPPPLKPKKYASAYFCFAQKDGPRLRRENSTSSNADVCKLMGQVRFCSSFVLAHVQLFQHTPRVN